MWVAIVVALVAVLTGRRRLLGLSTLAAWIATGVLTVALVGSDFSLEYVARTTSLATPWPYRLAALWGGMDGSMLFYATVSLTVGWFGLRARNPVRIGAAVGAGLLLVTALFANPFVVPDIPAVDGQGLLAILQHPAMIYHPPILYLGLVVLLVPFALTVAGTGDRVIWLNSVRRWLYVAWTLLTFGMAFGANWAYVELGWGGFWAWDPVENTALIPWLAATVFLHTSRVEEASGRMRRWNVGFASLPFALSIMGVYLTRSGTTGSIHSFAEDPVVGRILLASATVVTVVVAVVALRSTRGEGWSSFRFDRSGWLATSGALVSVTLVFVTAGSAYPAFVSVFGGGSVVVDSRFFIVTVLPVAVLIAIGLALGLRSDWRMLVALSVLGAALGVFAMGLHPGVALISVAGSALALLLYGVVTRPPRGRFAVAHVGHLGMALLLVAIAGTSFGSEFSGPISVGDVVEVADHRVELRSIETGEGDRYIFVRSVFDVDGAEITPEIRAYEEQATPVSEPVLRWGLRDDVVVATSLLFPDEETVAVSVFVRPLATWVWVGALLIGIAGLVALFGPTAAGEGRRRSARGEQQPGETTTGTALR